MRRASTGNGIGNGNLRIASLRSSIQHTQCCLSLHYCPGGETSVTDKHNKHVCATDDGMQGACSLGLASRACSKVYVSEGFKRPSNCWALMPSRMSLGRGLWVCAEIPGLWIKCPSSRAKIPVFDANLCVYLHHTQD